MDYHIDTQKLIDRQCKNVEREDFKLNKKKAEELILKTYDLFGLKRPTKIVWFKDLTDEKWNEVASSASSARSASSASSAWSASSASSAWSARSAWSAWSARSASSARSARSASSARSARSARSAIDYDFDWYIFEAEYCKNPDKEYPLNDNDKKYLKYCELLMEAKDAGLGYRIEWEDTLYLVPTPLVEVDEQNRFHSIKKAAIRWKGGEELYYLQGVTFKKEWWNKIIKDKMTPDTIFAIDNLEHRRIAYEFMDKTKMKKLKNYEVLDEVKNDGYKYPMKVISFKVKNVDEPLKYLNCFCASTGREYYIGTNENTCWEAKAKSFGLKSEDIEWIKEW